MLKIHALPLGSYQTNCYIVHDEGSKSCCIIDPGYDAETILGKIAELGLTVDAIALTHGHFDHVGAVKAIVQATNCYLWMHQADYTQRKNLENDYLYPLHDWDCANVRFWKEGEVIHAGGLGFTVMETPGHTQGSVCLLCENVLFTGDTLFAGSCGRTDLPGGDWPTILKSLARLAALEKDYTVYPGHGESTTLAQEKLYNPYLKSGCL